MHGIRFYNDTVHTCHRGLLRKAMTKYASIRTASLDDLDFLLQLERTCFPLSRQSSRKSLRTSIKSASQLCNILEMQPNKKKRVKAGSVTAICYKRTIRIYSIAVLPEYRGQGFGEMLVQHILKGAVKKGFERVTLEVDCHDRRLIDWYRKFSFERVRRLENFYGPGEPAFRMVRSIDMTFRGAHSTGNVIVVDTTRNKNLHLTGIELISAKEYLSSERFRYFERYTVLNLCNSYKTHTMGYYVSLLASARNHRVIPSVMTVKDISSISIAQTLLDEIKEFIQSKLKAVREDTFELPVILGNTTRTEYSDMAKKLFRLFEIPFFSIVFARKKCWHIKHFSTLNLTTVARKYPVTLHESIHKYFQHKHHRRTQLKKYKYDLAILVNSEEQTPPSCPAALGKFRKAGERIGFFIEFIGKIDYQRICEFDALFIRETTAIENHTYKFARHAYTEGLVVIDDPWSILFCSNKVYLYERLAKGRIKQPKSWLLTKNSVPSALLKSLVFPLVLKLPESTFSLGVYRVNTIEELYDKLAVMFVENDLVIAQEFLESAFDWRIGMLDNKPLFACKYYMANGHWQIYNWAHDNRTEFSGHSETIPITQVPAHILKAAVKSSSLIGDGLYGVDLKDINGEGYVIEINDNPNIDAGIEDELLQDELYERIMMSFFTRIERERQQPRYLL